MSKLWLSVVGLSLAGWWSAAASGPDDTARLAEMMRHTRGSMWLAASEFRDLQAAYLSWIDTRVKAGATAGRMSAELKAAGLLPTWSDDLSEMDRSHAGYVEPIRKRRVEDAPDVFVLEAAIYKGGGCSVDVTALVYERAKLKRLAAINAAGDDSYAYYLSGIDAAGRDNEGQRLIASGWVISNCTSTWNGKRIRIDRGGGVSPRNLLAKDLAAHDRYPEVSVAAQVQGDTITFRYDLGLPDGQVMYTASIARYRVSGDAATRVAPVALTRAGFIAEWLSLDDAGAAQWSDPQALGARAAIAQAVEKHGFEWAGLARCGGAPPVLEVALRVIDTGQMHVFRIAGARAGQLRMLSIGSSIEPSCQQTNLETDRKDLVTELPM